MKDNTKSATNPPDNNRIVLAFFRPLGKRRVFYDDYYGKKAWFDAADSRVLEEPDWWQEMPLGPGEL